MSAQTAQELGLISLHLNKLSTQKAPRETPTFPKTKDKDLIKILEQNKEVFNGIGKLKEQKIILDIDETVEPTAEPQRRVPYPRVGGGSSIVKVTGDVPPARVCFFGLLV